LHVAINQSFWKSIAKNQYDVDKLANKPLWYSKNLQFLDINPSDSTWFHNILLYLRN